MRTKDTRRRLRQQAMQAIVSLEFGQEPLEAARFAYLYEQNEDVETGEIPLFLRRLVTTVAEHKEELDQAIASKLKAGWTLDRLTIVDKSVLRLGLCEIRYFDETPDRVAVNEAIEVAKQFTDTRSVKFINGVLTQFIEQEN